jgi:hypothetical protein
MLCTPVNCAAAADSTSKETFNRTAVAMRNETLDARLVVADEASANGGSGRVVISPDLPDRKSTASSSREGVSTS